MEDGRIIQTEDSNMKQNRILNYIGAAGLLLAVCACGKENLNTTADGDNGGAATALPEGTFVVDYSVSDGETSRAFEGGLNANQRISSLLYLLYDSEGKLVKEREIPDINDKTTWPLTRDKMTWEQREALKDTLNSGSTYTAVFLANVKKDLFGNNTQTEELLQNKENLTEAVLYLPQTPFTDNNMYYLWKEKLEYTQPKGASDDSRDNPLSKKIILRRLVSRMDITKAEVTDGMIKEGLKDFYYQGETAEENKILQAVETALEKFADEACPEELSNTNRDILKNKLKGKGVNEKTVYSEVFESCLSQLVKKCQENSLYQSHVASWEENTAVSFTYTNQANIYNINSLQATNKNDILSNPKYSVLEDGSIVTIVFSNSAVSYDDFNQLSAFEVGEADYTLDTPWKVVMGPNEMVSLSCNPVKKISSTDPGNSMNVDVTVNMESLFGNLDSFTSDGFIYAEGTDMQNDLIDAINNVLTPDSYGSWDALKLTLQLPSLETTVNLVLKASLTEQTNP